MKKKVILLVIFLVGLIQFSFAQEKRVLTLEQVIQMARENSRSAKRAETQRNMDFWSFQVYKSQMKPQLVLRGTLPSYTDRSIPVAQPDGTVLFKRVNQNNSRLALGFEQVLPWTNTTVSFDTNLSRFDNFVTGSETTLYQGDPVGISIDQPLFTVNQYKWNRKIEPLKYEQSRKQYVQDLEDASRTAAQYFFQLLIDQKNLQIARQNEQASDTVYKVERGRYNIGTSTEDKLLQTELNLLTAQGDAQQYELDVQSNSLRLRNYIGLTENVQLELVPPEEVPEFSIDYGIALEYAKMNRAEYMDYQIQRLEAERSVATARATRFNASLSATYGYNSTQQGALSGVYNGDNNSTGSTVALTFALPILGGGRNKARMNQAYEQQKLTEFTVEQNMNNFEQEISTAVNNFEQKRRQIDLAAKRQEIALKRFEITNGLYLAGKVDILDLNNARDTKDVSVRSYISALQQYWVAYYEMRTLTLYDFLNNQILYNPLLEYDPKLDEMVEREGN